MSLLVKVSFLIAFLCKATAFDHNACAEWAQDCAYGCDECPDDNSCGCTYFTTHALTHGDWGHGYEGVCANLWSNFKAGKYDGWEYVSTNEDDVQEGFAVIMNNGHDGDASHCCVGTGKGKVSCHNPGHKDVAPSTTWYSGGYINAIWGWGPDIDWSTVKQIKPSEENVASMFMSNSTVGSGDSIISCSPYEADACNCVYYARDRQPKLPSGLSTCQDKENTANSNKAAPGCVLFRTGDPEYCHAAYVTKVSGGKVYYDQANWTPCECSSDSLDESSSKILGYWCP